MPKPLVLGKATLGLHLFLTTPEVTVGSRLG